MQQGQVFRLKTTSGDGGALWAYRYRLDGRSSRRIQRGGFATQADARQALDRALAGARRRKGQARVTLSQLAEEYLAQHDAQPETTAKLRWLLSKATTAFGTVAIAELDPRDIAAWRMTLPPGHSDEQNCQQGRAHVSQCGAGYSYQIGRGAKILHRGPAPGVDEMEDAGGD